MTLPWKGSLGGTVAQLAFGYVNERMFAIPSIAMDYYSDFFASNPRTHFCQINLLRYFRSCPFINELGTVMAERYHVGNLNASLFATEGIASLGPMWAPVSAFLCGLIISVGNSISQHLPASVIATSAALFLPALLNVPMSVSLLTHGLIFLFLLWYVSPTLSRE